MALQGVPNISSAGTLTLTAANSIYVYNGSTTATWTLPAISGNSGEIIILYNRGTGTVTVTRAGSDQINNYGTPATSVPMAPNTSMQLINDGAYWLVSTGGSGPTYDNSAQSSVQTGLASGSAFTWTQTFAPGSYGLIGVCGDQMTLSAAAVVTIAGTPLTELGSVQSAWGAANPWIRVFGVNNLAGGTAQTCSVKFTQSGNQFVGGAASFSYRNVSTAAAFTSAEDISGAFNDPTLTVTPGGNRAPAMIWSMLQMSGWGNSVNQWSLTTRQSSSYSNMHTNWIAGDFVAGATSAYHLLALTAQTNPYAFAGLALT